MGAQRKEKRIRERPPSPLFLKRYDCKGVIGWGSVNDMTGKDLEKRK
jgi:hypothetical protein